MNKKVNLLMFSSDYDKALAGFILANSAKDIGLDVTMFFAFWGMLLMRQPDKSLENDKSFYEKIFGSVIPDDPETLPLSKMNMGGLGKQMLVNMMNNKNAPRLIDLIQEARDNKVTFFGCKLSMDIMGLKKEELIPELQVVTAQDYLRDAISSNMQLFI